MSENDRHLHVRVEDEPEDERPMGTGESDKFEPDGLAADPYADDMLYRVKRGGVPRLIWVGVIAFFLLALGVVLVLALARASAPLT